MAVTLVGTPCMVSLTGQMEAMGSLPSGSSQLMGEINLTHRQVTEGKRWNACQGKDGGFLGE